jgi:tetratricopeptide (TPR) repeat protein
MTTRQSIETGPAGLLAAADEALIEAGFCTGEFDEARRLAEQAARDAVERGDRAGEASAAIIYGNVLHYLNVMSLIQDRKPDPRDEAAELAQFERAAALFGELGDEVGLARAAFGAGVYAQVLRDDWDAAMVSYRRAEALIPALELAEDLYTRSEIHRHLGFYHLVADVQPGVAVEHLRISLELRERQGEPRRIPSGLTALAWAERAAGDPARAVELARRAVRLSRRARLHPTWIADAEHELAQAEAALAAADRGREDAQPTAG